MALTSKEKNDNHTAEQKKLGRKKRSLWLDESEFKKAKEFIDKLRNA